MKIRKDTIAWIGTITSAVLALILFFANSLLFVVPAISFGAFLLMLIQIFVENKKNPKPKAKKKSKKKSKKTTKKKSKKTTKKKINWPLLICIVLMVLFTIWAVRYLIFYSWWFLLPVACLFGLLIWLAYLMGWKHKQFWTKLFAIALVVTIVLLGCFRIVVTTTGRNFGKVIYGNLIVYGNVIEIGGEDDATEPPVTEPPVTEPPVTEPPHTHSYKAAVTNPTCTDKGYTTYTCSCGHSYKDAYKNALGHSYKITVVEPTTAAGGYTEYKCERCNHSYKDNFTEKLHAHSYKTVVTNPTCTDKGYTTYTCSCGHSYKDAYKNALGHSYKTTVVEPTTAAGGYTEYKCERCNHSYKDNFTAKLPDAVPAIKCANTIRYGETVYVDLENISASNLKVSNKYFVSVEVLSDTRVAITLTEDTTGYLTVTDTVSGTNVIIDIVEG